MSTFKDHFSSASDRYAAYRPDYPATLFAWLAGQCAERDTAWDCATGSGQAALGLPALMAELLPVWGDPETVRQLGWPLFLRVGVSR